MENGLWNITLCERKANEGLSGQEADQSELYGVLGAFCRLQKSTIFIYFSLPIDSIAIYCAILPRNS